MRGESWFRDPVAVFLAVFPPLVMLNAWCNVFPLGDWVFGDIPASSRLVVALASLALGAAALTVERLVMRRAPRPFGPRRTVVSAAAVYLVLFLLRPRVNWGDSDWLIVMLREDLPCNLRWLTGIHILNGLYRPFSGVLYPRQFLTLTYCLLGTAGVFMAAYTVRNLFGDRRLRGAACDLLLFSFGTFVLLSGYIEIYPVANFGFIAFLAAALAFLKGERWMRSFVYGVVVAFCGFLYMGNLPFLGLGLIPLAYALLRAAPGMVRCIRVLAFYLCGAGLGTYLSCAVIIQRWEWNPLRMVGFLKAGVLPLLRVRLETGGDSWYVSPGELAGVRQVLEAANVWLLYGFVGLLVVAAAGVMLLRARPGKKGLGDGFLVTLAALVVTYLVFSYLKRYVMGFKDWDLFTYLAYPVNLLAALCLAKWPVERRTSGLLVPLLKFYAMTWFFSTFIIMNPLLPAWNVLPPERLAGAIYNDRFRGPTPASDHLDHIVKELEAIRNARPEE